MTTHRLGSPWDLKHVNHALPYPVALKCLRNGHGLHERGGAAMHVLHDLAEFVGFDFDHTGHMPRAMPTGYYRWMSSNQRLAAGGLSPAMVTAIPSMSASGVGLRRNVVGHGARKLGAESLSHTREGALTIRCWAAGDAGIPLAAQLLDCMFARQEHPIPRTAGRSRRGNA